jgi:dolichol-phosphate mannosyltransferase
MMRMALDGITALSTKPLRIAMAIGFLLAPLCFIYAVFAIASYARGITVPGWASILVSMLFLGAVQLITIGMLGEYVGRIYELARRLPPYVLYEERANDGIADREDSPVPVVRDVS